MSKNLVRSQLSLPVEFDTLTRGIGLPPSIVLRLGTRYGKVIQIKRPKSKQSLSGRIVSVPAKYHDQSVVVLPQNWKKMYDIKEDRLACKLIEPNFCKRVTLREVPRKEANKLPALGEVMTDKSVIHVGKYVREDNDIYKVESIDDKKDEAIIPHRTLITPAPADGSKPDKSDKYEAKTDQRQLGAQNNSPGSQGGFTTAGNGSYKRLNQLKGIDQAIRRIKDEVIFPFKQILAGKGQNPDPQSAILHGPPGCGKSQICHSIAEDLGITFVNVKIGDLASKMHHQYSKNLKKKFEEAAESENGAVLFLDELDAMASPRSELLQTHDREIVNTLLQQLDPKNRDPNVLVLAATNYLSSLDRAVTRSGRFDTKIPIPPPDEDGRVAILRSKKNELSINSEAITEGMINELGRQTIGHVGSDLNIIFKKAKNFRNVRLHGNNNLTDTASMLEEDLQKAKESVTPICETSMNITQPSIEKSDLPGSEDYVDRICEEADYMFHPEKYRSDISYQPNQAFLLHGPPGTGKTSIASAVANKLDILFKVVNAAENKSKWSGETVKNINKIFENARLFRPILIFIDEIDSIAQTRSSEAAGTSTDSINTLLTQFGDEVDNENIIFIGATNRKDMIDPALLRPGRFGTHIKIGKPEKPAIRKQFKRTIADDEVPHSLKDAEIETIVKRLSNKRATQADIADYIESVKRELIYYTSEGDKANMDLFNKRLKTLEDNG